MSRDPPQEKPRRSGVGVLGRTSSEGLGARPILLNADPAAWFRPARKKLMLLSSPAAGQTGGRPQADRRSGGTGCSYRRFVLLFELARVRMPWRRCRPCRVSSVVEQRFCKPLVGSSNLSPGTNKIRHVSRYPRLELSSPPCPVPDHPWAIGCLARGHAGYIFSPCDRPLQWDRRRLGLFS
jgi:hypothetical protein